jgi:hypothetical protein
LGASGNSGQAPGVPRSCLLLFCFSKEDSHVAGGRRRASLMIPCSRTGCVEKRGSRLGSWTLSPVLRRATLSPHTARRSRSVECMVGQFTLARPESRCECMPGRLIPATLLAARGPPQSALRNFSIPTGCARKITPACPRCRAFHSQPMAAALSAKTPLSPAAARLAAPVIRSQLQ